MQRELQEGDKITVEYRILQKHPDFSYCGKIGVILDLDDCANRNAVSIDFGSSILCVEKEYVKGICA